MYVVTLAESDGKIRYLCYFLGNFQQDPSRIIISENFCNYSVYIAALYMVEIELYMHFAIVAVLASQCIFSAERFLYFS